MTVTIIGVDCATQPDRTGIARGVLLGDVVQLDEVRICGAGAEAADAIAAWIADASEGRVLLAFDSPLGWPRELSRALMGHRAGAPAEVETKTMFRRATDEVVAAMRKMPLALGADRIEWSAKATLGLMAEVSRRIDTPIRLAWDPAWEGVGAIEVYPAATLLSHFDHEAAPAEREPSLVDALARRMIVSDEARVAMPHDADALDASVSVLAGADFARGRAHAPPSELERRVHQEGWIWFARTDDEADDAVSSALATARLG